MIAVSAFITPHAPTPHRRRRAQQLTARSLPEDDVVIVTGREYCGARRALIGGALLLPVAAWVTVAAEDGSKRASTFRCVARLTNWLR